MHSAVARLPRALGLLACALLVAVAGLPVPAGAAVDAEPDCPNRRTPPAPVDSPEQHPPDAMSTGPLPVPSAPAGGERMAACGRVLPAGAPEFPQDITAASWVVQNLGTGEVVAAKAPHARQRPASLIKLLLALVVVEHFEPDDTISPTVEDISTACSCAGLVAHVAYPVRKLLHALLMVSANDVAHAFGTALGGQDVALSMMNTLAERLGALDTRATTTSGLDARGMVSSAYDLSVIYNYAMEQPRIAEILRTRKITFPGGGKKDDYPIYNDNDLLGSYTGFLGGKTGYTDNARHTYVGGAQRGEVSLGVVLLRGKQRPVRMSEQAARLLDYGFALAARGSEPLGTILEDGRSTAPSTTSTTEAPIRSTPGAQGTVGAATSTTESSGGLTWIIGLVIALLLATVITLARRRRTDN